MLPGSAKGIKDVSRITNISLWKLILGILLAIVGLWAVIIYLQDPSSMVLAGIAVFTLGPAALLIWLAFASKGFTGYAYDSKHKYTGRENTIVLFARENPATGKAIPLKIDILELEHPPTGSRPHFLRNLKKHYYELWNNPATHKLEPVIMPDKKDFSPEAFALAAAMQPVKDYLDYSPPSLVEKVAPGIILLAIIIVGILMLVTTGGE